jgi:hypothetical protein
MKRLLPALAVLVIVLVLVWFRPPLLHSPASPRATEVPTPGRSVPAPAGHTSQVTHGSHLPPPASPPEEAAPLPDPAQQLDALRTVFRNYGQRFRGNPVGNNAEITAALKGDNPKGVNFLHPDLGELNARGELIDRWGTPYFFHQLSGYAMEIHSAGPDRRMGTADDLIIR